MRFALRDGERVEATPGGAGQCPGCGAELIARCGTVNVHHWAHKGRRHCDPWWENETDWHRAWKAKFPLEWQEVPARDEAGELHIADVKTPAGRVVEFQHSAIAREEVAIRTRFHRPIVWVVDGLRRKTDHRQIERALSDAHKSRVPGGMVYEFHYLEFTRLLRDWVGLGCPVAFDFGHRAGFNRGPDENGCYENDDLLLVHATRRRGDVLISAFGFFVPRDGFVRSVREGNELPMVRFDVTKPRSRGEAPRHYPAAVVL